MVCRAALDDARWRDAGTPRQAAGAPAAASDIEEQAEAPRKPRLQQEALYREPPRNPFRFRRSAQSQRRRPRPLKSLSLPVAEPAACAAAAPDEIGRHRDGSERGRDARTAVLSTSRASSLVRAATRSLGRYRVTAVEEEAVELVTISDGTMVRLTLKK